jgi:hypothetical protein
MSVCLSTTLNACDDHLQPLPTRCTDLYTQPTHCCHKIVCMLGVASANAAISETLIITYVPLLLHAMSCCQTPVLLYGTHQDPAKHKVFSSKLSTDFTPLLTYSVRIYYCVKYINACRRMLLRSCCAYLFCLLHD